MLKYVILYSLRLILVVVGVGGLWIIGLILFTRLIPSSPQDMTSLTDGIVVFTGGETRLKVAFSLFEQKKGKYLLISGVNPRSTLAEKVREMPFHSRITLGYDALDTLGNAEETAAWARAHHIETLRLITSNYHMPRSLFELRHLIPDIQILPHAVVGKSFLKTKWWLDSFTLRLVVQEYNKFLFALVRPPLADFHEFWKFKRL